MKKRKRKDDASAEEMFSEPPTPVVRLTPEDIQQKEFGVARMGGYRHHEVDEFLDELTRAMGELIEENERLRRADPAPSPLPVGDAPRAGSAAPGAGVQPFLERERDFLRALGELVQEHMEQVRAMARAVPTQGDPAAGAAPAAPEPAEGAAPAAPEPSDRHERRAEAASPAPQPAVDAPAPEPPADAPAQARPTEPINVMEAEPAVAGRNEEGGLRELFWGEDD